MRKINLAVLPALLLASSLAQADAGPGYISNILTIADDQSILFDQSGSRSAAPSCGAGLPARWAIDPKTPYGQSVWATLLSAYALHKQVVIIGSGACSVHGDTETVRYLNVPN